jgi:hypothetical protein
MVTCIELGCDKNATYRYKNDTKILYCTIHKKVNMVPNNINICIDDGCLNKALYNYEVNVRPISCLKHKKYGMINVYRPKCSHINCFNSASKGELNVCVLHMIKKVDNFNLKKCELCNKLALYNYAGFIDPILCDKHRKIDMINVLNPKICSVNKCKGLVVQNIEYLGYYCFKHKA